MSRIGKHPVPVPAGVDVAVNGQTLTAKGKLGHQTYHHINNTNLTLLVLKHPLSWKRLSNSLCKSPCLITKAKVINPN